MPEISQIHIITSYHYQISQQNFLHFLRFWTFRIKLAGKLALNSYKIVPTHILLQTFLKSCTGLEYPYQYNQKTRLWPVVCQTHYKIILVLYWPNLGSQNVWRWLLVINWPKLSFLELCQRTVESMWTFSKHQQLSFTISNSKLTQGLAVITHIIKVY